jgi:hypothetical protein
MTLLIFIITVVVIIITTTIIIDTVMLSSMRPILKLLVMDITEQSPAAILEIFPNAFFLLLYISEYFFGILSLCSQFILYYVISSIVMYMVIILSHISVRGNLFPLGDFWLYS